MIQFIESEHPRDKVGKFILKNSSKEYHPNTKKQDAIAKKYYSTPRNRKQELESKYNSELSIDGETATFQELKEILGKEYKGFKGQKAVEKLLQEKQGHIKGAFYRKDFGNIDLLWGNDNLGLQHIIKRREEQNINIYEFLSNIAEVVEKGEFVRKNDKNTFEIWYDKKMAIVSPEYHNNKITFLLTAYKRRKK